MPNQTVWLSYTSVDAAESLLDADRCERPGGHHAQPQRRETQELFSDDGLLPDGRTFGVRLLPRPFHLNPTTTNIVLNVTDAPNLDRYH